MSVCLAGEPQPACCDQCDGESMATGKWRGSCEDMIGMSSYGAGGWTRRSWNVHFQTKLFHDSMIWLYRELFQFLPPQRWQEDALQLCEHLSSSSRAVPLRSRGHRLYLRSCHRTLLASLTGHCYGLHQNPKISLCITLPLIKKKKKKLKIWANNKELTSSKV